MVIADIALEGEYAEFEYQVGLEELERLNPALPETLEDVLGVAARSVRARCARLRLRDPLGATRTIDWSEGRAGDDETLLDSLDLAALRPLAGESPVMQSMGGYDDGLRIVRVPIVPAGAPIDGEIGLIVRDVPGKPPVTRNPRLLAAARLGRNTVAAQLRHLGDTRRLAAVYLASPTLAYLLDGSGAIVAVTDLWLQHFGYAREEVLGRNARHFMTDTARREFMRVRDALWKNGGCRDFPCQFVTRDGRVVEVLMSASVEFNRHGWPVSVKCVLSDVTELLQLQRELECSRRTDALTGASTGDAFRETLERELARARRHERSVVVMLFELAHFDIYAARHGSAAAGEILAEMVRDLMDNLRSGDEVARIGGARFAVLLTEIRGDSPDQSVVVRVAERLVARMRAGLAARGAALDVAAGLANNAGNPAAEVVMARAGIALQRSREQGAHAVSVWWPREVPGEIGARTTPADADEAAVPTPGSATAADEDDERLILVV